MLQIHWHSKTWFKLRFSGFADEWNEDYLNKLFDNSNERNFESLEVLSVTINNGVLKRSDLGSDRKNKDKKSMKHVLKGDLVYNPMFMWKGASGISSYEGITSADYIVLKSKNNVNPIFFSHLFQTEKSLNKFKNYSQGSLLERLRLMYPQFSDIKMAFPSYEEQEKIANLLTFVDNKLELIEKKYQTYLDFKKYLMQQIFTQKLRFDFSDEWKIVKLESLIKKGKAGGTPSSTNSDYYNGDIPFLSIRDMTDQGKYIVKTEKTITEEGLNNSSAWIIPKNSLLYSIYASIGLVAINRSDISTSQAIYGIILKDGVSLEYMYYYLTYFKKNIHKYIETGTQGNLNAKLLKSFEILLPSLGEQEMIVNVLSIVDEKIENSKKEIEKINEFKKGLLQQMFVVRINWRCNFKLAKSPSFNKHLLILKNKIIFIIIK